MNITKHNKNGTMIWSKKLFLPRWYMRLFCFVKKWKFYMLFIPLVHSSSGLWVRKICRSENSRLLLCVCHLELNYIVSGVLNAEIWLIKKCFDSIPKVQNLINKISLDSVYLEWQVRIDVLNIHRILEFSLP